MRIPALLLLPLTLVAAQPQPPIPADRWSLPADETGLPGEGALRRYDAYVRRWHDARKEWAGRGATDQGAVVFLGDSITAGGVGKNGYVTVIKNTLNEKHKDLNIEIVGAGISGNKVPDLQGRLEKDVLSKKPMPNNFLGAQL